MGERQQRRRQTQIREHSERRVGEAGGDINDRHARRAVGVAAVVERGARKAADCDVGRLPAGDSRGAAGGGLGSGRNVRRLGRVEVAVLILLGARIAVAVGQFDSGHVARGVAQTRDDKLLIVKVPREFEHAEKEADQQWGDDRRLDQRGPIAVVPERSHPREYERRRHLADGPPGHCCGGPEAGGELAIPSPVEAPFIPLIPLVPPAPPYDGAWAPLSLAPLSYRLTTLAIRAPSAGMLVSLAYRGQGVAV